MLIDARGVDQGKVFTRDVCIVGAGAAGIALALALAERGIDVDLVESGGLDFGAAAHELTLAYGPQGALLATARRRFFGGTTNHWGGWCVPLEPYEFEPHPWVPHSGWPITREDLDPYYDAARKVLGLPHPHYRFDPAAHGAESAPKLLGEEQADFASIVWRRTQPTPARLGKMHRKAIRASSRIRCFLHANVTELIPGESGRKVEALHAATFTGRKLRFLANRYVLCAGAIENARILLLSDSVVNTGIGNQNDQVGRYFADHGFKKPGIVMIPAQEKPLVFQEELLLSALPKVNARTDPVGFATTPAFRSKNRLLGMSIIVKPDDGAMDSYPSAAAVDALSAAASNNVSRATRGEPRAFSLTIVPEQSPNPESRVRLHDKRDKLGLRKALLDHKTTELDFRSRRKSLEQFAIAVARSGNGRVKLHEQAKDTWPVGNAGHQTGTTRMADDPKAGVTDRNGRVHGTGNLFVAGSSLYPTAGWEHPTLTIIAVSLRLADFLEAQRSKT